ncbi:hypothetical protein BH11ARM2_BH11ARM2_26070 [soil metagenome]
MTARSAVRFGGGGLIAALTIPALVILQGAAYGGSAGAEKVLGFSYVAAAIAFAVGLVGTWLGGKTRLIWVGAVGSFSCWSLVRIMHYRSDLQWWSLHLAEYAFLVMMAWGVSAAWGKWAKELRLG